MPSRNSIALDRNPVLPDAYAMRLRTKTRHPRYSQEAVRREIMAMCADCRVDPKEVYTAIGMPQPDWSKRMSGRPFKVEELAAVADFFADRKRRPLRGWPILSLAESAILDAALGPLV